MPTSSRLFTKGFLSLSLAQFFGAVNDNLLKGVLSFAVASNGLWSETLGKGGQAYVGFCLTIPFILLSGFAGQLADRTSKRSVTVRIKIAEVGIALVGFAGFFAGNLWLSLAALVLLAIQSSFFGPAKYGMIPELVDDSQLSQANGSINMFTNLAVIAGTLAAGPVYSLYHPDPGSSASPLLWVPGVAMLVIAALGFFTCLPIPRLKAMDPTLKINWNPFSLYLQTLRDMAGSHLLLVAFAWASFYMIGMLAILILPDYRELLDVSPTKASVLLGILGVSIGIGSVSAGLISGKHIEPRLIPVGALGMTVFFALLGLTPLDFNLVASLLFGAGIFAGFYIVPLQSLLQHLSPPMKEVAFSVRPTPFPLSPPPLARLPFLSLKRCSI
jgi:acyl-[acyl-carrier-protein]-phospholipid O-acyltransferase/long-chain-fatty-acid--[acyl-carrier-protein] ligase